ncbi:MAG: hypothetical protein ACK46Y_02485 [Fluviicola sp.]
MKINLKNSKNYIYVALFAVFILALLFQLINITWITFTYLKINSFSYLILAFLLIPLNQFMEWKKWELICSSFSISAENKRNGFFAGIGTGFISPNGWGNFIGRLFYVERKNRVFVILETAFGNLSQLLATLVFGIVGLFFLSYSNVYLSFSIVALIGLLVVYFFSPSLLNYFFKNSKWNKRIQLFASNTFSFRIKILLFSLLRYVIFTLQFAFIFKAFWPPLTFEYLFSHITLVYLFTSIIPSFFSGKILIRETVALSIFSEHESLHAVVIVSSLIIWLFNNILPAVFSSFVSLRMKKMKQ